MKQINMNMLFLNYFNTHILTQNKIHEQDKQKMYYTKMDYKIQDCLAKNYWFQL